MRTSTPKPGNTTPTSQYNQKYKKLPALDRNQNRPCQRIGKTDEGRNISRGFKHPKVPKPPLPPLLLQTIPRIPSPLIK